MPEAPGSARQRIFEAALLEVEASGLGSVSLEAVARRADLGRATLYRHFPNGRDGLLAELVRWEVVRFWMRVADAVAGSDNLEDRLVDGLMAARRLLTDHALLTGLLAREAEVLLPLLEQADVMVDDALHARIRSMLAIEPVGALRSDLDLDEAATYISVLARSIIANPAGIDMTDRARVRELVRTQFIGGMLAPANNSPKTSHE